MIRRVTVCGSFRKFPETLESALQEFKDHHIEVLSPRSALILDDLDGFVTLRGDVVEGIDLLSSDDLPRAMRSIEDSHLSAIQRSDAVWLIAPGGYLGLSSSFEIGWALAHCVPVFYDARSRPGSIEPVMLYANPISGIAELASSASLPRVNPIVAARFARDLFPKVRGSAAEGRSTSYNATIACGPLIVDASQYPVGRLDRDILLVKTHKWGGRYSIVGGKKRSSESLEKAFQRVVGEQTGLDAMVSRDICAFDELPGSGYFKDGGPRIFIDKIVEVPCRDVCLDHRAQSYTWMPPKAALQELDIEPNARKTIVYYLSLEQR